jgi:rhodanese-related sulfurtransferase
MKNRILPGLLVALGAVILLTCCTGNKPAAKPAEASLPETSAQPVVGNETSMLLKDLRTNGNYVNTKEYPSLIKASIVHENLGKNILVVDLRSAESYSAGHIKGAVNRKFESLPEYFQSGIKPFKYDKIIMVCNDGQLSAYTTCLLRLMGYGNVYAMRWGMSAWNRSFAAENWLKGVSAKYEAKLDTVSAVKPVAGAMPDLGTSKISGEEIGSARFVKLFSENPESIFVKADELFADPDKYFIINLERKDKYADGHIPGAVRYKPEATLSYIEEMATIPSGKPVVVYCSTGHSSAFATAYLRLFGYDAHTLKYGNNSFMFDKMGKERVSLSWLPFQEEDINNYETVK